MHSVGIVGGGVVGAATARSYVEHTDVKVFDVEPSRRTHGLPEVLQQDIIFVCLPSPRKIEGYGLNTEVIEQFFHDRQYTNKNYVLKSTVPIGFTETMARRYSIPNLVHSPEFITARCAALDAQMPARNIIGGVPGSGVCCTALEELYAERFPHVNIVHMHSKESEAVKLVQNAFFAVKVAFWNEAQQMCEAKELDWDMVRGAVLQDGRIHPSHTQVPGPDGLFGFGGTCLPKDLNQFVNECRGCSSVALGAMIRNEADRKRGAE